MPIALYVGSEMQIKVANKAILKAWGKGKEVIGKNLADALPELKGQPFLEILKNVFETGKSYQANEDRVELLTDGTLKPYYFDFVYKPLKDDNGKVWGILNNATDVTALVNAKLNIKESETRFRRLITEAPVAIGILKGPDLIIEDANEDLLKVWRKDKRIIGLKLIEGLPEIANQEFPDILNNVYQTGKPYYGNEILARLEEEGVLKDYYFNFIYDPIFDHNHQVNGILIVASEVTAQVRARNEISQSETRFRNLLLEAPLAAALYETEDIVIRLANAEMLKMWGKDESVIGKPMSVALPELTSQPFINILKKVYRTGLAYQAEQQEASLLVDGVLKKGYYNFTYKPLRNTEGKVFAILHAAMDVSKQVQLQLQKDEFLSIASHELKTPVTSIKAYTQVLERMIRKDGDEKKADMVHKMDLQLNRLSSLIGNLLDVTKIQSGKITFNPTEFNFDDAVLDVVEEMQYSSNRHLIQTELKGQVNVFADRDRICQVVFNFISNAIKYSADADVIQVKSYIKDNEVILGVQDFGIGISPEEQEKVFDQFYRAAGSLLHTYSGLGLGLYISAEIIRKEGGRIWLESTEGKGSTFYFALEI